MAKNATVVLRGTAMYAKVLGDPVLNYDKDGKEWKFDFIPDAQKETAKDLHRAIGVAQALEGEAVEW